MFRVFRVCRVCRVLRMRRESGVWRNLRRAEGRGFEGGGRRGEGEGGLGCLKEIIRPKPWGIWRAWGFCTVRSPEIPRIEAPAQLRTLHGPGQVLGVRVLGFGV